MYTGFTSSHDRNALQGQETFYLEKKHLPIEDKIKTQISIENDIRFRRIAKKLGKDCSTASHEECKHSVPRKCKSTARYSMTASTTTIAMYVFMAIPIITARDSDAATARDFAHRISVYPIPANLPEATESLSYVCNGCQSINNCTLERRFYYAKECQRLYEKPLYSSSSGIAINGTMKNKNFLYV